MKNEVIVPSFFLRMKTIIILYFDDLLYEYLDTSNMSE